MADFLEDAVNWSVATRFEMNPLMLLLAVATGCYLWNRRGAGAKR